MYRLDFLNNSEQLRLKDLVSITLKEWMDAWVLNFNCRLDIQSISYKEFSARSMVQYVAEESKHPIFYTDENFLWDRFIFNDVNLNNFDHPKYLSLLDRAKKDFINTIFSQKNFLTKKIFPVPKMIDAYLSVSIGSDEIGFVEFIAPHCYFLQILGKSINKKSKKIFGDKFSLIAGLKIPIVFKMNFNDISFSNLIDIKPGAILKSGIDVNNSFSLCINKNEIAQVSMGKRQNNKAYLVKGKDNG